MSKRPHKWRDVAWKRAIIDGADDFVGFVMKKLDDKRDQSRDITGVAGMELHVKDSDTDKGMLVSDAYLNVPVKGGDDCNVACLVEQQHDHKDDFPERIFNSWVRLRASRPERRVTAIAVYTGNSKDINHYEENCLECEASLKFNTFHLPSCKPEQLREDEHPFACVMYAGLLSYGTEDNAALREKYALEILNMTERRGYNDRQK
ncbi:MAG: hypothetical protein LBJ64_05230, partial [Deltaproteobacteria bacterium]|nr:hypothetical protein [Deltaproteobacteria bacterium]